MVGVPLAGTLRNAGDRRRMVGVPLEGSVRNTGDRRRMVGVPLAGTLWNTGEDNIHGGIENTVDAASLWHVHSSFSYARTVGCNVDQYPAANGRHTLLG